MYCQACVYLLTFVWRVDMEQSIRLSLDKALERRKMTRYELSQKTGIGYQTIDKYYKNRVVRYDSYLLLKICAALSCGIEEIIEIR